MIENSKFTSLQVDSLPPTGGIAIHHFCLLVGWFVRWHVHSRPVDAVAGLQWVGGQYCGQTA